MGAAGAAAAALAAPAGDIAAAVLAARFFIADGLDPGFLAMLLKLTTFLDERAFERPVGYI